MPKYAKKQNSRARQMLTGIDFCGFFASSPVTIYTYIYIYINKISEQFYRIVRFVAYHFYSLIIYTPVVAMTSNPMKA